MMEVAAVAVAPGTPVAGADTAGQKSLSGGQQPGEAGRFMAQ